MRSETRVYTQNYLKFAPKPAQSPVAFGSFPQEESKHLSFKDPFTINLVFVYLDFPQQSHSLSES